MEFIIEHNQANNRFETIVENEMAILAYELKDGVIYMTHTEVPPPIEGRGVASALAKYALNYARTAGLLVVPLCSFVRAFMDRKPEYQDLRRSSH
jgi:predicted GNAT family acetyltransferase